MSEPETGPETGPDTAPELTRERVAAAYASLVTGDRELIARYWSEDVRFQMPGNHQYAGWFEGLDEYLEKMGKLMAATKGRISSETLDVLIDPVAGVSVDVYRLDGHRGHAEEGATSPYDRLRIEGVHVLRWEDGRIAEGRSALFADGVTQANLWWSPVGADGTRHEY
ncbi:nuclear transport factor 2 family protein [Streptomyces sp. NPDC006798]|uniref:nuclear transport factor 2 family protein n=1 Tax=Streptomyces sp. NPDC006798 TaxID=3155462 RepID=UPI0033EFD7F5